MEKTKFFKKYRKAHIKYIEAKKEYEKIKKKNNVYLPDETGKYPLTMMRIEDIRKSNEEQCREAKRKYYMAWRIFSNYCEMALVE